MFNFLIGRALMRFLENLAEPEKPAAPKAEVTFAPDDTTGAGNEEIVEGEVVYPRVTREAMGSLFEIYLAGTDRDLLTGAGNEALEEIARLDRQLSHYKADSDITRLNAHATDNWVRLEPRLYQLLKQCAEISAETGGAFDITAGPLVKAWGFHDGEGRVPSDEEIGGLLERTGTWRIAFDDSDNLVNFTAPGMEINLGAVGKGYALDEAARTLGFYGVRAAVLHGGQSTILAVGAPPGEEGWPFTIKDPRDHQTPLETVTLHNEALSTSGDYEQFFERDGVRYTHILDPRTGRPVQGMASVSVICESAAESDALSTAFFVMGPEAARAYCAAHAGIRVVMVEQADDSPRVTRIGF